MQTVLSYQGVVKKGHIQLSPDANLPEGSQVIVLATDEKLPLPLLDPHLARRKANGWLITHVGHLVAQQPQLKQVDGKLVWRFAAFLTSKGHSPRGPVGIVDVDAYLGDVVTSEATASEMIANAQKIIRPLLPTES